MDIKVERDSTGGKNYFEKYAVDHLSEYFDKYRFVESIKVFFRGEKHKTKKIKLQARLKGKDVFVEASAERHDLAIDLASKKLKSQVEKYKSKRYKRAS